MKYINIETKTKIPFDDDRSQYFVKQFDGPSFAMLSVSLLGVLLQYIFFIFLITWARNYNIHHDVGYVTLSLNIIHDGESSNLRTTQWHLIAASG